MKRFLVRLSSAGLSPITSEPAPFTSNGYDVFWRGYIANTKELVSHAARHGRHPVQQAEAELLALANEWWGADLPRHVLGEYAAAIYDRARSTLLLTHDELGLMPLFYAEMSGSIIIGSHLEDVIDETGIGELDEEYIADYLAEGWHLGERTPYTHIRRLLPGQSLIWKDDRLTPHETWTLTEVDPLRYRDLREYERHFRHLLADAVTSAIPTGAKILCELSGGLDSSTVLALAVRGGAQSIEAFSFIYPKSYTADERTWINAVLKKYPVPWHSINSDEVGPFTEMPDGFCSEPNILLLISGRQRSYDQLLETNNIDVVLTGVGGDAALVGDGPEPYYLADLLRSFHWGQLLHEIGSWSHASGQQRPPIYWLTRYAIQPLWLHMRRLPLPADSTRIPWLSEDYANRVQSMQRNGITYAPRFNTVGDSWFFQRVLLSAYSVSMRSQRARTPCAFHNPLLYRPLLTYMSSVPWQIKLHPKCDRLLQRRALEDVLPDKVVRRRSKLGPDQAFYAGLEANPGWRALLTRNSQIVQRGYADANKWRQAVEQARLGRTVGIRYLVASASLEVWLQQLERRRARRVTAVSG